jgi:threonine dehydratase
MIWEGNASIVDELVADGVKPGAIVLSVGGGGLLCGVQRGLERHGWQVGECVCVSVSVCVSVCVCL